MSDPIAEAVRAKLLARSRLGIGKYGTTLADSPESRLAFLIHAQEEAMDLANYLEVLIQREASTAPASVPDCAVDESHRA